MTPFEMLKEASQEVVAVVAIIGGAIAAYQGIHEMHAATKQRHEELRWKRAQAAKEILHDVHVDKRAANAVTMLDWMDGEHVYEMEGPESVTIRYAEVLRAVSCPADECRSKKDVYIRDCFDWFLYYLDRIEHYIQTGYIDFVDVKSVFKPYIRKISKNIDSYKPFIEAREYDGALKLIERYDDLLAKELSAIAADPPADTQARAA